MHPIFKQLFIDIDAAVSKGEQDARQFQHWFPMPQSNVFDDLTKEEAKNVFNEILYSFLATNYYKDEYKASEGASSETKHKQLTRDYDERAINWAKTMTSIHYPEGYDIALKLATTGAEGGIRQVINTLFDNLATNRVQSFIDDLIKKTWGQYEPGIWTEQKNRETIKHHAKLHGTRDEREAHVRSYKDAYAAFLPSEFIQTRDCLCVIPFHETLSRHHKLMQRAKGLIR